MSYFNSGCTRVIFFLLRGVSASYKANTFFAWTPEIHPVQNGWYLMKPCHFVSVVIHGPMVCSLSLYSWAWMQKAEPAEVGRGLFLLKPGQAWNPGGGGLFCQWRVFLDNEIFEWSHDNSKHASLFWVGVSSSRAFSCLLIEKDGRSQFSRLRILKGIFLC